MQPYNLSDFSLIQMYSTIFQKSSFLSPLTKVCKLNIIFFMSQNLTEGNISKSLLKFSLPFLLANFLQLLYGLADLYVIGKFCFSAEITAVSVGSQVMHLFTVVIIALSMGTTVMISHNVGAKNQSDILKTIGNSVTVFAIFSIILCAISFFSVNLILKLLSVPQESLSQTRIYLIVCFSGLPFIVFYNLISSILRGLGDSKTPMFIIFIACLINIFIDFLLIGYFKVGVLGAALGTVISQGLSVVLGILILKFGKTKIPLSKEDFRLNSQIVKRIFFVGLPIAVQDGFIQISFIIITKIANSRGVEIAAAVGIVEKIIGMMFLAPSSMLSSISTFCAQNAGAAKHKRAIKALFLGMIFTTIFGIFFTILSQFIPENLVSIFTSEKTVIRFGAQYLRSYVFDCILAGFHFCFSGFFAAYQKSILCFIHNIISVIAARIPLSYLATKLYPENLFPMGLAAPIGSLLSSIICVIFFVVFFKKYFESPN